jgi:hypothetical protein
MQLDQGKGPYIRPQCMIQIAIDREWELGDNTTSTYNQEGMGFWPRLQRDGRPKISLIDISEESKGYSCGKNVDPIALGASNLRETVKKGNFLCDKGKPK